MRILKQKRLKHFLFEIPNDEQVHLALGSHKASCKQRQLHRGQLLQASDDRAVGLDFFGENTLQFHEKREVRIHLIVLLAVAMTRLYQTDAAQVLELAANRVDLLRKKTCQLTDEVFLFRMKEEGREQFDSGLRRKQRLEDSRRHVVHKQ